MKWEAREKKAFELVAATGLAEGRRAPRLQAVGDSVGLYFACEQSMLAFQSQFQRLPADVKRTGDGLLGEPSELWLVIRKETLRELLSGFALPEDGRVCEDSRAGSHTANGLPGVAHSDLESEARMMHRRWVKRSELPPPLARPLQPPVKAQGPIHEPEALARSEVLFPKLEYPRRVTKIVTAVKHAAKCITGAAVHAFGSAVNGFGDGTSDIDMVVEAAPSQLARGLNLSGCSQSQLVPRALGKLAGRLHRHNFYIDARILNAKVPILKLRYDGCECDLSCNNLLPLFNTRLLKAYADIDARVVRIVQEFKAWAKAKQVHGAPNGHLSSYAMTLMVIFYMQVKGALPCLQRSAADHPKEYVHDGQVLNVAMDLDVVSPCQTDIYVDFSQLLYFFRDEFKWGEWVVSVRVGVCKPLSSFPELTTKWRDGTTRAEASMMLHIEDPFETKRNLNSVLAPGSNQRLWCAISEGASPSPLSRPNTGNL